MPPVFANPRFNELLSTINEFHKLHGITILINEKPSLQYRIWRAWLRIALICEIILFSIASSTWLSTNTTIERFIGLFLVIGVFHILAFEFLTLMRKKRFLKLVRWCHQVETYEPKTFVRPVDWFRPYRDRTTTLLK